MAFSQPNARGNSNENSIFFLFYILHTFNIFLTLLLFVELQNRKILEELQLKKQMLLKQGVAPTLNTLGVSSTGSVSNIVNVLYQ